MPTMAHGSGGCSTLLGSVTLRADLVVGGKSAHFEYLNIATKKIFVDHCIQEQSSCNVAGLAGTYFPTTRYSQDLKNQLGDNVEQSAHLGLYELQFKRYTSEEWDLPMLEKLFGYHEKRFPGLRRDLLRCRLENRFVWFMKPFDLPTNLSSSNSRLKYLQISSRDNQKLLYPLPLDTTPSDALMIDIEKGAISYKAALDLWMLRGQWKHFIRPPAFIKNLQPIKAALVDDWETNEVVDRSLYDSSYLNPHFNWGDSEDQDVSADGGDVSAGEGCLTMIGCFAKRSCTLGEAQSTTLRCSIANFSCVLRLNVQEAGGEEAIGPLVDIYSDSSQSSIDRYTMVFSTARTNYLSLLGSVLQKLPIAHPSRIYDPNRAILFTSMGGQIGCLWREGLLWAQNSAPELCDVLFQAYLVQVLPAAVIYVEWTCLIKPLA
jgi:hypothetical protein